MNLINDINNLIDNWNEYDSFTIKGIDNLTRADLDTLLLYADTYATHNSYTGLMPPAGNIKHVLDAYNMVDKFASDWSL